MSNGAQPQKIIHSRLQLPTWLWVSASGSFIFLVGFLFFLSKQTPDQYALTEYPPWQHGMNHKELIAYHRALKSGSYAGHELQAKGFLYRQGTSAQLYASQDYSNTNSHQSLARSSASRPLTMDQALGFAFNSQPVNQYSLQQAQQSIALERNRLGMINTTEVASSIPAGIYIQTASLRSINDAGKLRQTLQARGFSPFIQEAIISNQTWYRVRFGPYPTVSDAKQAVRELKSRRYAAQIVYAK